MSSGYRAGDTDLDDIFMPLGAAAPGATATFYLTTDQKDLIQRYLPYGSGAKAALTGFEADLNGALTDLSSFFAPRFFIATGGGNTYQASGSSYLLAFTSGSGTLVINQTCTDSGLLIIGGGGGGGINAGGGGGAGGFFHVSDGAGLTAGQVYTVWVGAPGLGSVVYNVSAQSENQGSTYGGTSYFSFTGTTYAAGGGGGGGGRDCYNLSGLQWPGLSGLAGSSAGNQGQGGGGGGKNGNTGGGSGLFTGGDGTDDGSSSAGGGGAGMSAGGGGSGGFLGGNGGDGASFTLGPFTIGPLGGGGGGSLTQSGGSVGAGGSGGGGAGYFISGSTIANGFAGTTFGAGGGGGYQPYDSAVPGTNPAYGGTGGGGAVFVYLAF